MDRQGVWMLFVVVAPAERYGIPIIGFLACPMPRPRVMRFGRAPPEAIHPAAVASEATEPRKVRQILLAALLDPGCRGTHPARRETLPGHPGAPEQRCPLHWSPPFGRGPWKAAVSANARAWARPMGSPASCMIPMRS